MRIPAIKGIIDRRILVNFRVDPDVLSCLLPKPFRPKLHDGHGIAGICLIRLRHIRPAAFPLRLGLSSENAAHRIAVEWDAPQGAREGVYIPRRDTSSRLNAWLGGRIFPGVHHHARFQCSEHQDRYQVQMSSDDGSAHLHVAGILADALPQESVFSSLDDASQFFERGSLGYSATAFPNRFDALELHTLNWSVKPLTIDRVQSSFFDNSSLFPAGAAKFDCALLMRDIDHEWYGREEMCCP